MRFEYVNGRMDVLVDNAETEAVNTTEAVNSPKAEVVSPPKSEAVNPPNSEAVNPPNTEAVSPPKTEAVDAPSLELYVDEKEGFKLLRPALWNKVNGTLSRPFPLVCATVSSFEQAVPAMNVVAHFCP